MFAKKTIYVLIIYCFVCRLFTRELGINFPLGLVIEALLILSFISAAITVPKENWKNLNNSLFYLFLGWFIISVLEVANPAGANIIGWLNELRSVAEYPLLIVSIGFLIFNSNKDLDNFLYLTIGLSVLGALYGIKQLHIGLSRGDYSFLANGGAATHMLWGRLRVFSFYAEASQFGSSQAHIGLMALILSFSKVKPKIRILLIVCSLLLLYGMLISGTRGALFALVPGVFLAIILSKKIKVLIIGGALAIMFLGFLKFTTVANGNYQIYRLRSALNPDDPSLNVRFESQKLLKNYMSNIPFGGGLGVTGYNGMIYNPSNFLSKVQPDSFWVKVWIMYGIVGLVIWISMMTYILGRCCGIVWRIEDEDLKIKAIALVSGFSGILICSYGNEIINAMPSSIIVCISLVFLYNMPRLERELLEKKIIIS